MLLPVPVDHRVIIATAIVVALLLLLLGAIFLGLRLRKTRRRVAAMPTGEAMAAAEITQEEAAGAPAVEGLREAPPELREEAPELPEAAPERREAAPEPAALAPPPSLGLRKTRESFLARLRAALTGSAKLEEIYAGLEEALIAADMGVEASLKLAEAVRSKLGNDASPQVIRDALKEEIVTLLREAERPMAEPDKPPLVVMLVGVNGVGKTTTLAKLAARFKIERGPVVVGAADTFRAAAIEQLEVWCKRVGADLIRHKQGADPAAVAFDAVNAAVARGAAVLLVDTAGRMQTKVNLMAELKKIARVIERALPGAPHETWLVLDATTGQNAMGQAKIFDEAVPLTGVVLAKLDSTAKGGMVAAIADKLKIPVRFVGVGEKIGDLRRFDAREFVDGLFENGGSEASLSANGPYAA